MSSTILPSSISTHLQRPRLVAVPTRLRPVLAERGRAVGRLDRDDPRVAAGVPGPEPPGEDVVAPREPEVERRHRLRGVLVDQRRQGIHVVRSNAVDVPLQELRVRGVDRRGRRRRRDVTRLEGGARPLQRAVHGRDARLEELRDLRGLPAQHLAEDEHRALARRELLKRSDEREANGLARADDLGRIARPERRARPASARSRAGRACAGSRRSARPPGRGPSAARGASGSRACRSRRSSRCGRATSAAPSDPRSGRTRARRG